MARPTPGPLDWVAVPASQSGFHLYITDTAGRKIAALWGKPDEKEGNAVLFASAPDLLALLEELVDIEGPCPGTGDWAEKVHVAIAKAKGGDHVW